MMFDLGFVAILAVVALVLLIGGVVVVTLVLTNTRRK
jgi:hypothetical protein